MAISPISPIRIFFFRKQSIFFTKNLDNSNISKKQINYSSQYISLHVHSGILSIIDVQIIESTCLTWILIVYCICINIYGKWKHFWFICWFTFVCPPFICFVIWRWHRMYNIETNLLYCVVSDIHVVQTAVNFK